MTMEESPAAREASAVSPSLKLPATRVASVRVRGVQFAVVCPETAMDGVASRGFFLLLLTVRSSLASQPRISPFHFPQTVSAGEKISVSCLVTGDSPLEIRWLKDASPLQPSTATAVTGDDASMLVIKSASAKAAGNYTCLATNAFGTDSLTARLRIRGQSVAGLSVAGLTRSESSGSRLAHEAG